MRELIAASLLITGAGFCLVAALGVLRLPDTLIRLHAATKAGTLGAGCILLAEAVLAARFSTSLRALAVVAFLFLTAPVGAHLIGRAAYHRGVRLFHKTCVDELASVRQGRVPAGENRRLDADGDGDGG